jgi:Protein containing tetrapyrrole methyltransferase domain and MazG-like (predicted pyrophosphatase) domain
MKKSITPGSAPRLFAELVNIMARLRGPNGCPWDKHQTNSSLVKYLLEEAGEVRSAVRKKDWENLAEELGDVLLQVVFHSQIAQEKGTVHYFRRRFRYKPQAHPPPPARLRK